MVAGRHMTGKWHATGWRASDGVGQHARVQVVRAVVVAHDGAGNPLSQPCQCGWGRMGWGWRCMGKGEGRVRAGCGSWVGCVSLWVCVSMSVVLSSAMGHVTPVTPV